MSRYPCELIEDLLPLYVEDDLSNVTKEIVKEHIEECEDCAIRLKEYNNDELKIDDFKEDLPEAHTFKKWMKKLKIGGIVIGLVFLISIISTGIISYKVGEDAKKDILTLKTIVKTFEKEGLSLEENNDLDSSEFILGEVKPKIFNLDDDKGTLLIYVFDSFNEKEKVLEENNISNNPFNLAEKVYEAKNSVIIFKASSLPENEEEAKVFMERVNLISDTVFKHLNNGKERVYKGESENWEGTFTLKYYEHLFEEDDSLQYDSYHTASPVIKYKGEDLESIGDINFEYEAGPKSGASTGLTLNEDGYGNAGQSGGNGSVLSEKEEIKFTINWNGKEESFILKAE